MGLPDIAIVISRNLSCDQLLQSQKKSVISKHDLATRTKTKIKIYNIQMNIRSKTISIM